ncbi:MAG: reverse transcriptase family protein, partial [Gammaproteobacteria bacterium]|nr:reverse transcriptase family protein [Gammaproteobacteria bacterium]
EVIKRVDLDDVILSFCNNALCEGQVPDQWKLSNIVPVPKKGDLTETDNYRGISVTSIVSKTLNRMILNRVKPCLEKLLRNNQNGFRPGRSTTSHILALRRILEGAKAKNLSAVMLFIDFKKAFDSVHRGILMKILRAYGLPDIIVDLIERMYTGTLAKVITPDGLTEVFKILAGVLQGDTLAPYLFIIVIDYLMTITFEDVDEVPGFTIKPARSRRVKAEKLADTEFADDVALITNTIKEAQSLLDSLESAAKTVGLQINESKTKYLAINTHHQDEDHPAIHSSNDDGDGIELVDDFVYLGAWIASTEHDFKVRKAKAWAACHKMKKIWKSDLRRDLKIRLFQATVESILLYGSETWTITVSLSKRIDGCYTRMLRMALNVDWRQRITNKVVYGHLPRVTSKIQARRMKLAGHIQRHDELVAHNLLLWEPQHGARGRGRPPLTFVDTIRRDTELTDTDEIRRLMTDRQLWRRTIDSRTLKPPY